MDGNEREVSIPTDVVFPPNFPEKGKAQWRDTYSAALEQARVDSPDETTHRQIARREANRIFRVGEVRSYAQAKSLDDWKTISREEKGGSLHIVTIEGRKFSFLVPASGANADGASASGAAGKPGADGKDAGKGKS